jgi:hypothetical protein
MKTIEQLLELEKNSNLLLDGEYISFLNELNEKISVFEEQISNYQVKEIADLEDFRKVKEEYSELYDLNEVFKYIGKQNFDELVEKAGNEIKKYKDKFNLYSIFKNYKGKNIELVLDNIETLKYDCNENLKETFISLLKNTEGRAVPYFKDKNNHYEFGIWFNNNYNGEIVKELFINYENMLFSKDNEYMKFVLKLEKSVQNAD